MDDGGKRGYHHGDLPAVLVDTATELIREHGPAGSPGAGRTSAEVCAGIRRAVPDRVWDRMVTAQLG